MIIIISPLDIKDLSFSSVRLSFSPSSLPVAFNGSTPLSLSLSPSPYPLSLTTRVSLPGYQRFLPRSFLPSSTACFSPNDPVPRVALGFREMTICKLLRRRLSLTTIPGAGDDGNAAGSQAILDESDGRERVRDVLASLN